MSDTVENSNYWIGFENGKIQKAVIYFLISYLDYLSSIHDSLNLFTVSFMRLNQRLLFMQMTPVLSSSKLIIRRLKEKLTEIWQTFVAVDSVLSNGDNKTNLISQIN